MNDNSFEKDKSVITCLTTEDHSIPRYNTRSVTAREHVNEKEIVNKNLENSNEETVMNESNESHINDRKECKENANDRNKENESAYSKENDCNLKVKTLKEYNPFIRVFKL